mmetsp:Transcript_22694/g.63805  ORF Transcript_22694/g.63805 Transcript_22694/m.63805 type:complete len:81 (+) Transcript_22694:48-290(+)
MMQEDETPVRGVASVGMAFEMGIRFALPQRLDHKEMLQSQRKRKRHEAGGGITMDIDTDAAGEAREYGMAKRPRVEPMPG